MAGEYERADTALSRAVALHPGHAEAHYLLALVATARGDYALAEAHLARVPLPGATRPRVRAELARVEALAGRTDEARPILEELRQTARTGFVPSYELAALWLAMGDAGRALVLLDEAAADRDADLVYLRVDPRLERLRGDRRFTRVVRRLGLP
jgi:thioredoxin-like negative regulator of GroEL